MLEWTRRRRVFISYARTEIEAARYFERKLSAVFVTWMDKRDIVPGQNYDDTIVRELRRAQAVVVLWSNESAQSGWVHCEASAAKVLGKLVLVRITDTALPTEFQYSQAMDWLGWEHSKNDVELDRLIRAVRTTNPVGRRPWLMAGAAAMVFAIGAMSARAVLLLADTPGTAGNIAPNDERNKPVPEAPMATKNTIEQTEATLRAQPSVVDPGATAPPAAPRAQQRRQAPVKLGNASERRIELREPTRPSEAAASSAGAGGSAASATVASGEVAPVPPSTSPPNGGASRAASDASKGSGRNSFIDSTRIK